MRTLWTRLEDKKRVWRTTHRRAAPLPPLAFMPSLKRATIDVSSKGDGNASDTASAAHTTTNRARSRPRLTSQSQVLTWYDTMHVVLFAAHAALRIVFQTRPVPTAEENNNSTATERAQRRGGTLFRPFAIGRGEHTEGQGYREQRVCTSQATPSCRPHTHNYQW